MYNVPCRYMYIPQYTMLNIYVYMYTYVYMYIPKYPIPNTKKGHQKIPFLLTSRHNSDLQSHYREPYLEHLINWL